MASEFAQDWHYSQKPLVARWNGLTSDDFSAWDGDLDRLVQRLASCGGISQVDASNDLAGFAAQQRIHWRLQMPTVRWNM